MTCVLVKSMAQDVPQLGSSDVTLKYCSSGGWGGGALEGYRLLNKASVPPGSLGIANTSPFANNLRCCAGTRQEISQVRHAKQCNAMQTLCYGCIEHSI